MSRLIFHCNFCDLRGDRKDSYHDLPGEIPAFTDTCPRCHSDELEVIDPVAERMARTNDD